MDDFFERNEYSEEDINQLLENDIEESLNLDYKSSESLGKQHGKKKEIAKDISAFANSDGGIIIYGIREKDHIPFKLNFVDGNEFTKEWLEQVINTNIQRRIKGLKIFPIRFDDKLDQTIYLVKIPPSNWAPHMSNDNRYYRRFNFESVPMHEYEVRNLFNRREKTKLKFNKIKMRKGGSSMQSGKIETMDYYLSCSITNDSNSVENYYKIQLSIPSHNLPQGVGLNEYFDHAENGINHYSIPGVAPIFQNEVLTMFELKLRFNRTLLDRLKDIFTITLYYSNGTEVFESSCFDAMKENGIDPRDDFR